MSEDDLIELAVVLLFAFLIVTAVTSLVWGWPVHVGFLPAPDDPG